MTLYNDTVDSFKPKLAMDRTLLKSNVEEAVAHFHANYTASGRKSMAKKELVKLVEYAVRNRDVTGGPSGSSHTGSFAFRWYAHVADDQPSRMFWNRIVDSLDQQLTRYVVTNGEDEPTIMASSVVGRQIGTTSAHFTNPNGLRLDRVTLATLYEDAIGAHVQTMRGAVTDSPGPTWNMWTIVLLSADGTVICRVTFAAGFQ